MNLPIRIGLVWLPILILALPAAGQPFADRIPEGAIFALSSAGLDHVRETGKQSPLPELLKQWKPLPPVLEMFSDDGPLADAFMFGDATVRAMFREMILALPQRPLLFFALAPPAEKRIKRKDNEDWHWESEPEWQMVFMLDAGPAADRIVEILKDTLPEEEQSWSTRFVRDGSILIFATPDTSDTAIATALGKPWGQGKPGRTLASAGSLQRYQDVMIPNASLFGYADADAFLKIKSLYQSREWGFSEVAPDGEEMDPQTPPGPRVVDHTERTRKVIARLGVDQVRGAVYTAGFRGPLWMEEFHLRVDRPTGMLGELIAACRPVTQEQMARVPSWATSARIVHMDARAAVRAVFSTVRDIQKLDEKSGSDLDAEMKSAAEEWGFHPIDDLAMSLGELTITYTSQEVPSLVLLHKLSDPAKAKAVMAKLIDKAGEDDDNPIRSRERMGTTAYTVSAGPLDPTWAITDGFLVAATSPALFEKAVAHLREPGELLVNATSFQNAIRRVGGTSGAFSVEHCETQSMVEATYAALKTYYGMANLAVGGVLPELSDLLPAESDLTRALTSPVSGRWFVSDQGVGWRAVSPIPAAGLINPGFAMSSNLTNVLAQLPLGLITMMLGRASATTFEEVGEPQMVEPDAPAVPEPVDPPAADPPAAVPAE